MGHQDKGHYALKHQGKTLDKTIAITLSASAEKGQLTCSAAHRAAAQLNVSPEEIGMNADLMELRLTRCKLGLFGYGTDESAGKTGKSLDPDIEISMSLDRELDQKSSSNIISCKRCWEIAARFEKSQQEIGSACEKKQIRIKPCQLGAF